MGSSAKSHIAAALNHAGAAALNHTRAATLNHNGQQR